MSTTACPIVIKVPVHTGYRRATLPSVAARLQAREKPERKAVTEEVRCVCISLRAFVTAACVDRDGRRCVLRARFRRIRSILFVKDRAAAFIAFRTARIPPLSDAAHVPSHGNLTKNF